ncbi:hypothetical protein OG870_40435 [Streptomyces sp. NBC_00461]|uniref:hypothetical protein n=1 Tax=Streptomyces sp. NBC_00461 TaxID=2975750 RepID=UPI002E174771
MTADATPMIHVTRVGTRHEPAFNVVARPLWGGDAAECIHYGTHFSSMFRRCCPDRTTTKRIDADNRMAVLAKLREEAVSRWPGP